MSVVVRPDRMINNTPSGIRIILYKRRGEMIKMKNNERRNREARVSEIKFFV